MPKKVYAPGQQIPHRVLIVDDRPDIRLLLRTRLSMIEDIEVVGEGSNGAEALILVSALAPDVVLLDLDMPVMRGDEAIPRIRMLAPGVRILLFTGAGSDVLATIHEDSRPDDVVTKGGHLSELVDKLRVLLEMEPHDVLRIKLGKIPLDLAVTAFDTWVGLNMRILDALARGDHLVTDQLAGATPDELQALVGVYAHLGDNLQKAAREQAHEVIPIIHLLRATAAAARRALVAFNDSELQDFYDAWNYTVPAGATAALAEMREQLIEALPTSSADDHQQGTTPNPASPAPKGGEDEAPGESSGAESATRPLGVVGRAPGHAELRREMARARDTAIPLTVVAVTVGDRETSAAAAGDLAVAVGAVLSEKLRVYDLVVRHAPNEFLCVLPGMDLDSAAERMAVVHAALPPGPSSAGFTYSMAVFQEDDSLESFISRAAHQN